MTGPRKWSELPAKPPSERDARIEAEVAEMVRRMTMKAARQGLGVPKDEHATRDNDHDYR